jgi:hypothetical protein
MQRLSRAEDCATKRMSDQNVIANLDREQLQNPYVAAFAAG